MNKICNQIYIY